MAKYYQVGYQRHLVYSPPTTPRNYPAAPHLRCTPQGGIELNQRPAHVRKAHFAGRFLAPAALLDSYNPTLVTMKLTNVGIEQVHYPVQVLEKTGGHQQTVASIRMQAIMPRQHRGNCLATFMTILGKYQDDIRTEVFPKLLADLRQDLQADSAFIEMTFPYFIEKRAPVSKTPSLMEYTCRFACGLDGGADLQVSVLVPSTTLCPCSKEISQFGAHNQRAEIDFTVQLKNFIWLEDLITMVESCTSCEVYSLLKRPDEKFVTEKAYENPMFVEDVVRKIAVMAQGHPDISWFSVGVESFESIHKHSAYAYTDSETIA